MSYREAEKQRDQNRKAERQDKFYGASQYFHNQAREAQNESNRAYGFQIRAKVGR